MKIKDYIDGLFYLIMGKTEKDEASKSEKVFVILMFVLIFALGFFLAN